MNENIRENLFKFGFNFEPGSSLTKRTVMTGELFTLFNCVQDIQANLEEYKIAVMELNCLGKRTIKNRGYSFSYLKRLYGLSPNLVIFRAFRYFFDRDENSRVLLCLLTGYSRDLILQASADYIFDLPVGASIFKLSTRQ